jgi:hypothetical protein
MALIKERKILVLFAWNHLDRHHARVVEAA